MPRFSTVQFRVLVYPVFVTCGSLSRLDYLSVNQCNTQRQQAIRLLVLRIRGTGWMMYLRACWSHHLADPLWQLTCLLKVIPVHTNPLQEHKPVGGGTWPKLGSSWGAHDLLPGFSWRIFRDGCCMTVSVIDLHHLWGAQYCVPVLAHSPCGLVGQPLLP